MWITLCLTWKVPFQTWCNFARKEMSKSIKILTKYGCTCNDFWCWKFRAAYSVNPGLRIFDDLNFFSSRCLIRYIHFFVALSGHLLVFPKNLLVFKNFFKLFTPGLVITFKYLCLEWSQINYSFVASKWAFQVVNRNTIEVNQKWLVFVASLWG